MSEFFRAIGGDGYGRRTDTTSKQQRHHEALCDGRYCENERCPKGMEWRARTGYRLKDAKTGLRGTGDAKETVSSGDVREGRPEMLAQGPDNGKQEPTDRDGAVSVPALSQANREGVRETGVDAGADTRTAQADAKDRKAQSLAERIARLRARLAGPGPQPDGQTDRTAEPMPAGSTVLPTLQAEDRRGIRSRDEKAVAKAQRGRPRKYVTAADRAKAYRQRRASRKA